MKLLIGLGNPGSFYSSTRHNAGFIFVEELQKVVGGKYRPTIKNQVRILKSDRFMNDSGVFVKNLVTKYSLSGTDLFVVHDDLDIPLGDFKIQFGKGPKDHNGILSIEKELGTKDFWRIRIGIENRDGYKDGIKGEEYVLQNFTDEEKNILGKVVKSACKKLEIFIL